MNKIIGLIQARMGSTRLPGKVMMKLAGKPLIWHLIDRLQRVDGLNGIVLATTYDPRNDEMVKYAQDLGVDVYREKVEDDIVSRLVGSAEMVNADAMLKVNGDCPIADVDVLQKMLDAFREKQPLDYLSNKVVWSYPKGLSTELISTKPLIWCNNNLKLENERELVCDWIKEHDTQFKISSFEYHENLSHHDWMIDTRDDYTFMAKLFNDLYRDGTVFGMHEVLEWISFNQNKK